MYKNISVSAHPEPDAARVSGQHGAAPQADGHHAEEPLREGAPPAEGPGADIHPVLAGSISTDQEIYAGRWQYREILYIYQVVK